VLYLDKGVEQMRFGTAVKKIWNMEDSQGQILASAFKYISSKRLKLFPVRSEAETEPPTQVERERELFFDNLLVRIHFIIEMTLVDRPCVMGF
jgi:hypothetical protein